MSKPNWTPIRIRLGQLQPWSDNPKLSTKKDVEHLVETENKFGQPIPFCVSPWLGDKVNCYDGHQRLNAWQSKYGLDFEIWAFQSDRHLTEQERKDFVLQIHQARGQWDWQKLSSWGADDLKCGWFDSDTLKNWNNDTNNLKEFLKSEQPTLDAEPEVDRAAELLEKWQVKPGDMFQIGEHRLICGDCTDAATVARVMGNERAELAPVDPPYNVGFEYDGETVDDEKTQETYEAFSIAWFTLCESVSDRQIVSPGCYNLATWLRIFNPYHWTPWVKANAMTNGKVSRFWCWEPMLFFGDGWKRKRSNDIFDYPVSNQKGVGNHPCPKPLKMWQDLIENYSEEGAIIFESFGGSGTTLVACQNTGRVARAVEISPEYCSLILERMSQAFPGIDIHCIE